MHKLFMYILYFQSPIDFAEAIKSGRYTIRWSDCKPLDLPTWWAHAVTIGPEVYVCGGNSNYDQSEDVFVYHTLEDTWRTLPQPGLYYTVPVSIGNKLTIVGGQDTTNKYKHSAKVLTFDTQTQSWINQFPNLLTARRHPGVVVCSHYLIVAGGELNFKKQFSNDIEFLNLEESPLRWKKSVVKLPTNMWDLVVFSSENYFWIVGYGDTSCRRKKVHRIAIADIVSSPQSAKKKNDWVSLADTIHLKPTLLSKNGSIPVLLGGENNQNNPNDAISYYDSDTFTWKESQVAFLSTPRVLPAVSLIGNNAVMAIGGCTNSKQIVCEDYSLKSVEIGILEIKT